MKKSILSAVSCLLCLVLTAALALGFMPAAPAAASGTLSRNEAVLLLVNKAELPEELAALLVPADEASIARVLSDTDVCPQTEDALLDGATETLVPVHAKLVYTESGITAAVLLADGTTVPLSGHAVVERKGEYEFAPRASDGREVLYHGFFDTEAGTRFYSAIENEALELHNGRMVRNRTVFIQNEWYSFDENGYASPAEPGVQRLYGAEGYGKGVIDKTTRTINPSICVKHHFRLVIAEPATCTTEGDELRVCTQCGTEMWDFTPAKGHRPVKWNAVSPTCTEAGWTEGRRCSVCGAVLTKREKIPALGHDWGPVDIVISENGMSAVASHICLRNPKHVETVNCLVTMEVVVPPTCEEMGSTHYTYTAVFADGSRVETEQTLTDIPPAHTPQSVPGYEPTCTEDGLSDGAVCAVCGVELVAQQVIPALGHAWVDQGDLDYHFCAVCGEQHAHIPPEHQWKQLDEKSKYDRTKLHWAYCTVCGGLVLRDHEWKVNDQGERTGVCKECGFYNAQYDDTKKHTEHTWGPWTDGQDGTHFRACTECGQTESTAHTFDEGKVTLEPTCEEQGVKTYTCTACGAQTTEPLPALGHTEETIPGVEATCTETGLTEGVRCSVCGEILVPQQTIPMIPHQEATRRENETEGTCETEGGYDEVTYCSVCGEELGRTHVSTGFAAHQEATRRENETAGTCQTEGGYDEVTYCSVCGEELGRTHVSTGFGTHKEATRRENETAGTCQTEGGYDQVTYCSVCGEELGREHVSTGFAAHKEATRKENEAPEGYDLVTYCIVCGDELGRSHVSTGSPTPPDAEVGS